MTAESIHEKTLKITQQIYPLILDRLKNEGWLPPEPNLLHQNPQKRTSQSAKSGVKSGPKKFSQFVPELDFFIARSFAIDQLRHCGYNSAGSIHIPNHDVRGRDEVENPFVGFSIKGNARGQWRHDVIIPSSTLKTDVSDPYLFRFDSDFRVEPNAQTRYMPGVVDRQKQVRGEEVYESEKKQRRHTNKSTRLITWEHNQQSSDEYMEKVLYPVIKATREYWNDYEPDDGGKRIVTKATMMEILDKFELGEMAPGSVPWYVEVLASEPTPWDLNAQTVSQTKRVPIHEAMPMDTQRPRKVFIGE